MMEFFIENLVMHPERLMAPAKAGGCNRESSKVEKMTTTMRATLVTLGVVALAGVLGESCSPAAGGQQTVAAQGVRRDISALTSGKGVKIKFSDKPVKLPDFSIQDINGKTITPADWAGKVVLINFWATWCGPCRSEIPELIEFQKHYADELVIVGLSVDEGSPADVKKFVAENGMNYTVAIADEALQKAFGGVTAVPSRSSSIPRAGSSSATWVCCGRTSPSTRSARSPISRRRRKLSSSRTPARSSSRTPRTRRRFPASTSRR